MTMADRVHPKAKALLAIGSIALLICSALVGGCSSEPAAAGHDVDVAIEFVPNPPAEGATDIRIALTDAAGRPVRLGHIEVEGNMNHAGMKPVFARLEETEPGRYGGTIEFTMGGDWFLLLSGPPTGEGRLSKKVDVRGVKAK
jgi:hypothetical protein